MVRTTRGITPDAMFAAVPVCKLQQHLSLDSALIGAFLFPQLFRSYSYSYPAAHAVRMPQLSRSACRFIFDCFIPANFPLTSLFLDSFR
ncbi:MAG: hypothetical protein SPH31_08510 [Arcanobacterium sp.]|nr:hypothetical protein [Arcanobacterium sp.]